MKKTTLLLCIAIALLMMKAQAQLTYTTNSGAITITGHTTALTNLVIPANINGYPVTALGDNAFRDSSGLTNATIPNTVVYIGQSTFFNCPGLTSIVIPDSVTDLADSSFSSCTALTNLMIGSSVTNIDYNAIRACTNLTRLTIPASVSNIGFSAFDTDTSLTNITFLGNAPSLGNFAFNNVAAGAAVYYYYGTSGWGTTYGGLPTVELNAPSTTLTYTTNNGGITITGFTGAPTNIVIPDSINGYPVTGIDNNAIRDCTNLTSLTIPASVVTIGISAFDSDSSLTSVIFLGNSLKTIGAYAFYNCVSLTNLIIPSGVTNIENDAFDTCMSLMTVTIPASVTTIGAYAFSDCESLTNVDVENSIIGNEEFFECTSLTNVILNNVGSIGLGGFDYDTGLTTVTIPASVTNIGDYPFGGCTGLTNIAVAPNNPFFSSVNGVLFDKSQTTLVELPAGFAGTYLVTANITNILEAAFWNCPYLTNIATASDNPAYSSVNGVLFNKSQTTLVAYPAGYPGNNYVIPNGVTSIGNAAFTHSPANLTNVVIPNGVTNINYEAFYASYGLTSIFIPSSVVSIGAEAFYNDNLTNITFMGNAPMLADSTEFSDDYLPATAVYYFGGTTGWGSSFGGLPTIELPNIPTNLIYTTNNGTITITGFTGTPTNIIIPDSISGYPVTSIADDALFFCFSLTNVVIGTNVTTIGDYAFYGSSLTSVVIPNGVADIGDEAFASCYLTSVVIGDGVTNIGVFAFGGDYLTNITVAADNPAYSSLNNVLFNSNQTTLVQFPQGYIGSYIIPGSVTSITDYAFEYCAYLTSVTIPASVTNIGASEFDESHSLTNINVSPSNPAYSSINGILFNKSQTTLVEFPEGDIGSYTIPAGVTNINDYGFQGCQGLTNVVIGNGITSIGNGVFNESGLTSVLVGANVTSIGNDAFEYCTNLTSITFLGNAPTLGDSYVFHHVPGTVYYYYGTSGWSRVFGGLPTVMLGAPVPQIGGGGGSIGVKPGGFSFTIGGVSNQTVTVEASTNLVDWQPVWTNTLSGTNITFTDPQWTNHPSRFYRAY